MDREVNHRFSKEKSLYLISPWPGQSSDGGFCIITLLVDSSGIQVLMYSQIRSTEVKWDSVSTLKRTQNWKRPVVCKNTMEHHQIEKNFATTFHLLCWASGTPEQR